MTRSRFTRLLGALSLLGLWAVLSLCAASLRAADDPTSPLPIGEKPVDFAALHNVVRLSEKLYSGGVPEGEAGFAVLQKLGIKTVITVDGAKPNLKLAKRVGMRYIHIPFGYDGCPVPTANAIARAVRDLPGPVYIHCHHGKHRSPTAAAFARMAIDGISNEQAVRELERAGTGKNYTGLYGDVRSFRPPSKDELDGMKVRFREVSPTAPLVETMIGIEQRFDRLSKLQKNGWKAEPGVEAAYEALQLHELYTELNRAAETRRRPEDYRRWSTDSEVAGKALEASLRAGRLDEASMNLGRVAAGCGSCHAKYRNVPQERTR